MTTEAVLQSGRGISGRGTVRGEYVHGEKFPLLAAQEK